jgi:hypothetical protein
MVWIHVLKSLRMVQNLDMWDDIYVEVLEGVMWGSNWWGEETHSFWGEIDVVVVS